MPIINKAHETMTAKERVRRTFEFERTDRVTIGYDTNPAIHRRFCEALGVAENDWLGLYRAIGVDYLNIGAGYTGPKLFDNPSEGRIADPLEGYVMRWVENPSGGYWDFCDFPLKDASDEDFEHYPIPNPDDFDYEGARAFAVSQPDYALYVGNPGMGDVINSNGRLMGMEDALCHLMLGDGAAMDFIRRRADYQFGVFERLLDKCRGLLDFVWLGEDLGTQIAPMVSLELYRRSIKPIHKLFIDAAKSYGLPVLIHTCGSSSWAYEDFIEMGVRGVDTLQPEAVNMSPQYLHDQFGGRLNFRGCISTAGPLAYGTAQEVDAVCADTLRIMMDCRGYHFAPTHQIQDNTPTENVIAMYNAAHRYGVY